eukprot:jgi/Mesen1/7658/ME000400S06854
MKRYLCRISQAAAASTHSRVGVVRPFSAAAAAAPPHACTSVYLTRFGSPDYLEVRHDDVVPSVGPTQVLVRVLAASVNPLDIRMREGYGRSLFEPLLPVILGRDVSGEVAATGSSVKQQWRVGDEVFGALHPTAVRGSYSHYALLEGDQLAPKPSPMSHVEAAAVPFAALTAWRALHSTARIAPGFGPLLTFHPLPLPASLPLSFSLTQLVYGAGVCRQRVLVLGGGGAVGLSAIQLASAAGCYVATTCGNSSMEKVKAAGASQAVHYASQTMRDELGEGEYDAVLDTIGVPVTEAMGIHVLARGGSYMTLQGELVQLCDQYGLAMGLAAAAARFFQKQLQYQRSHSINYYWTVMRTDADALQQIALLAEEGRFNIPVGKVLPLTQAAEAHRLRDMKLVKGKVVLQNF